MGLTHLQDAVHFGPFLPFHPNRETCSVNKHQAEKLCYMVGYTENLWQIASQI